MDFTADLSLFYAEFGEPVVHHPAGGGDVSGFAIFDCPGTTLIGGDVIATDLALRYPFSTFPAVTRGDAFTIDGEIYTAREAPQEAGVDGVEYIVPLARS